jgi:hypothetical protein
MNVWMHNKFQGHWPVGTAAVVVANTREDAATYLDTALGERGLPNQKIDAKDFIELRLLEGNWYILCDGDY